MTISSSSLTTVEEMWALEILLIRRLPLYGLPVSTRQDENSAGTSAFFRPQDVFVKPMYDRASMNVTFHVVLRCHLGTDAPGTHYQFAAVARQDKNRAAYTICGASQVRGRGHVQTLRSSFCENLRSWTKRHGRAKGSWPSLVC